MRDLEHARLLVKLAQDDLAAMQAVKSSKEVPQSIFGFHAQQSVEKYIKA